MLSVEYITNRVFNSRTYILTRPNCGIVWLVDCGDTDRVLERIKGIRVEGVLLTHTHSDHIYGLAALMDYFPDVTIITNAYGVKALGSPNLNISHYHSEYPDIAIDCKKNVRTLTDGDYLDIMGVNVHAYETPGHDASCLTYIIEDKIFTGDAFIPGVRVFTGFPHSNRKQAQESVVRIIEMAKDLSIMPGHTLHEKEIY